MSDRPAPAPPPKPADTAAREKEARLAAALRSNLRRRKGAPPAEPLAPGRDDS